MSKTTLHSFTPLQRLGEGTFSSVYKVKRISDGRIYALKKIKIASLKQKQKLNALNQIRILASISSPYIVTYKEAFFDQNLKLLCIVMELADGGDLYQKITTQKQAHSLIPQPQIWKIIYHLVKGLDILHTNRVLHRDLKSANIFINSGVYKIGDLNVSKVINDQKLVKTQTGTPYYASPEVWRDQPYGQKSDIWSLGCIIYQICTFQPPFLGDSLDDLFKCVQRGRYTPISSKYSKELHQTIQKCLNLQPQNRPSTQQLLQPQGTIMTKCLFYDIETISPDENNKKPQQFLSTIKMPFDINKLNNKLPHSQYDQNHDNQRPKSQPVRQNTRESNKSAQLRDSISKRQGNLSTSVHIQKQQKINKSHQNISPSPHKVQKEPLPQRIRQHLQSVVHKQPHQKMLNRRPKYRIHTSIGRQRPMLKPIDKIPLLGSAIYNNAKKIRPASCEIKNRPTPLKSNLNPRPLSGIQPIKMKKQVRSIQGQNQSSIIDNNRYNRPDLYFVRPAQQKKIDNDRCRSAQYRRPINSSYMQLKKRFQTRQKQLNASLAAARYPQQQNIIKSDVNLLDKHQPYITKQVYIKNQVPLKKIEKPNQNRQYLQQIQNKIINSNNHKTKKCIVANANSSLEAHRVKGTYNKYKHPF